LLIDSHVHLDTPAFDEDRNEVIARAREAGIDLMLEIAGSDIAEGSLDRGLKLAEAHDLIYAAIGVHPHEAKIYDETLEKQLIELSDHPKVIGWGEIGLDYHYAFSPRDSQVSVFRRQLELASERNFPVIIHTREAEDDTIAILSDFVPRGVMHCFTGSAHLSEAALEVGLLISFSGVLTFKNAGELREIAASVPLDRLLIETDCPYLAPVPHRGKRNEPAFVRETAIELARLRSISLEELADVTSANFRRLFNAG
jgi:TatD DNase family protein